MATGRDLVEAAFALMRDHRPQWYSKQEPRNAPHITHHADCSGGLCYLMNTVGIAYPESNSWAMAQQGHRDGLGVPLEQARHMAGVWFVIGANEGQTNVNGLGHIGMFIGDGTHTFEWRGRWAGVGVFDYRSHYHIDYCMRAPGIDYTTPEPPPPPVPKEKPHSMGMIVLPNTQLTPVGRVATAVEDFTNNRVLLEDGARLIGDHESKSSGIEHWWAPAEKDQVPGWSLVAIAPIVSPGKKYPEKVVVRYAWGDGNGGTYLAEVAS